MSSTVPPLPSPGSRVELSTLRELTAAILVEAGMRPDDAVATASLMLFAQESGVNSHGLAHLPAYVAGLVEGALNPRPELRLRSTRAAVAILDADRAPGLLAGLTACDAAVDRAARTGIGAVAVRNSSHFGVASAFVARMVSRGTIALVLSNASPTVAPRGARTPLLGTNPIAAGFPRADGPPVIVDLATTAGARGPIRRAAAAGRPIPDHWALDAGGRATTDPRAALEGTMQALGGEKGTALGLMVELFCVALSGGSTGAEALTPQEPSDRARGISHLFVAFDAAAFDDVPARVGAIARAVETAAPVDPSHPPRMPGARAAAERAAAAEHGVTVDAALHAALVAARELTGARSRTPSGVARDGSTNLENAS